MSIRDYEKAEEFIKRKNRKELTSQEKGYEIHGFIITPQKEGNLRKVYLMVPGMPEKKMVSIKEIRIEKGVHVEKMNPEPNGVHCFCEAHAKVSDDVLILR